MAADVVIVHLYPDLLRTYGDRGNVVALRKRAEWRGFDVEVVHVSRGERVPDNADIVLLGGGSDRVQEIIGPDLLQRRDELGEAASRGGLIVGICGGYQLLGREFVAADGTAIEGLGLLDITTGTGPGRIIGRVQAKAKLFDTQFELFGFENHGGRTRLGPSATPLARVPKGQGNNGEDRGEGAAQGTIVGTYLHGPVLPMNPALADALLEQALAGTLNGDRLKPLDDALEYAAHAAARGYKRK